MALGVALFVMWWVLWRPGMMMWWHEYQRRKHDLAILAWADCVEDMFGEIT